MTTKGFWEKVILVAFCCAFVFVQGCSEHEKAEKKRSVSFKELDAEKSGIDFRNDVKFSPELNIVEYLYFNNGGGVAIGDINNDGLEDLYFTSNQGSDKLYLNKGNLSFEDISLKAGISDSPTWSSGVVLDDINGDGWNDIYVCKVAPISQRGTSNELYINQKNGTFIESSKEYDLDFSGYSTQASFFDYDNDGDLDMYLLNHSVHSINSYGHIQKRKISDEFSGDRLFENRRNEGIDKFTDVTNSAGIYSSALGYGLGIVTSDVNDDGWVDIYVGNDFHDNDFLYINNQDGTFTESINELMTHCSQYTMGVDIADIDRDGNMDVYTTDMKPYDASILLKSGGDDTEQIVNIKEDFGYLKQYSRNTMQLQDSNNNFVEGALMTKTYASDWSWSCLIQDFDNNGSADIFITNGIVNRPNDLDYIDYINDKENDNYNDKSLAAVNQRLIDQMPSLKIPNILFSQDEKEKLRFERSFVGQAAYSSGAAYADLDLDGDLDIVTNNVNSPASILENISSPSSFISIDLGNHKNSKIKIYQQGEAYVQEHITTRGYQSASTHMLHFGLRDSVNLDSLVVTWADGYTQVLYDVSINQHLKIDREKDIERSVEIKPSLFNNLTILNIRHTENQYNDLDIEPLMPYRYSREGPSSIFEDFDGDLIEDLIVGGSKNSAMQYFKGLGSGNFRKINVPNFDGDAKYEDVDMASIDFNNDGYNDLYVVSGGNERNEQNELLQDRIYVNNKQGSFYRLPISLPHTNGSCIAIDDYNNDGYDDLFIGSQNVPGAFGVSPVSFLLKNNKGERLELAARFRDGMIGDALWKDLTGDETPELIVAPEWTELKVYQFQNDSSAIDIRENLGIPDLRGVFTTVESEDINNDGRPDILLGNLGHNTSWAVDEEHEVKLYLDDFDGNSYIDPIVFYTYDESLIPFVDKTTLRGQIPTLSKEFATYRDYSNFKNISQLYSSDVDQEASTYELNILSSGILVSQAERGYSFVALPDEAQVSNIEDFHWVDAGPYSGSLIFVGNNDKASHKLGETLGSRGGILSNFDGTNGMFKEFESLNLPIGVVSKRIHRLSETDYIIINNDNIQFLLELKK